MEFLPTWLFASYLADPTYSCKGEGLGSSYIHVELDGPTRLSEARIRRHDTGAVLDFSSIAD